MFGDFVPDDEMFDRGSGGFDERGDFMEFDPDVFHRVERIETV